MPNYKLQQMAGIARAISDETRIRLLLALRGRELCACQLYALVNLAPSTVSEHLSQLRRAGLVATRKLGRWVHYRLNLDAGGAQVRAVIAWLEQNCSGDPVILEDERYLKVILEMPPEELCSLQAEN